MAVANLFLQQFVFPALARSTFVTSRAENAFWLDKQVSGHSAQLHVPNETRPYYPALRVKGRQRQTKLHPSLALPTLYPKSRVVGSGLIRYMELCTVTRNLFIQSECVFSSWRHESRAR